MDWKPLYDTVMVILLILIVIIMIIWIKGMYDIQKERDESRLEQWARRRRGE